jgi:hypothetical protein
MIWARRVLQLRLEWPVWVMALFGKGAPPVALSLLRDGPAGLLRSSGRGDGIPLDDEEEEGGNEEEDG